MNKVTQSIIKDKVLNELVNEINTLKQRPILHKTILCLSQSSFKNVQIYIESLDTIPTNIGELYDFILAKTSYDSNSKRIYYSASGFYSDPASADTTYGDWVIFGFGRRQNYPSDSTNKLSVMLAKTGDPDSSHQKSHTLSKENFTSLSWQIIQLY